MHKCFTILCCIMICGCMNERQELITSINPSVLDSALWLYEDSVYRNNAFMESRELFVYKDSFVLLLNYEDPDIPFLGIYKLSGEYMKGMIKYGNGHGEMLSAELSLQRDNLIVNDYIKGQLVSIQIDSLLKNQCAPSNFLKYENSGITSISARSTGEYVIADPFYIRDDLNNIKQGEKRLFEMKEWQQSVDVKKYKYDTWNIGGEGILLYNSKCKKFMYANKNKSVIEIYDDNDDITLEKEIVGPIVLFPEYSFTKRKNSSVTEVAFKGRVPCAYICCCMDEAFVYFLYIGDYLYSSRSMTDFHSYILKYDWNGNLIKAYQLERFYRSISKGYDEDTFYATRVDGDGNTILVKLKTSKR